MIPEEAPCLVTAWKALSDMLPVNKCELVFKLLGLEIFDSIPVSLLKLLVWF